MMGIKTVAVLVVAAALTGDITAAPTRGRASTAGCVPVNTGDGGDPDNVYPIADFSRIEPADNWTSYAVDWAWHAEHFVSGPHVGFSSRHHHHDPFPCLVVFFFVGW